MKNNEISVEFPIECLDLSSIVHNYFKEWNTSALYHLNGISIHSKTFNEGHNIAIIKNMTEDRRWYKCDDDRITEIKWPNTSGSDPYLLFYYRNDVVYK